MNLVILTGGAPGPNGQGLAYHWIRLRAKAYREKGNEVCVLAPQSAAFPEEYLLDGVKFYRVSPEKAVEIIGNFSPEAVLIHHVCPWTMKVSDSFSYRKIPWIYGPEVTSPSAYYYKPGKFTRFFLKILEGLTNRKLRKHFSGSKQFVCTSNYAAAGLSSILPGAKFEVIYSPVDIKDEAVANQAGKTFLKGLAIEPLEHRTLLACGLDLLIQTFSNMAGTSLTLAGSGNAREDLQRWISREKSSIELRPSNLTEEEIVQLFRDHDYFVITARIERQIFRACQAMACGLPVMAPNLWAFPEAVLDGKTGVCFDVNNLASLRKGVTSILENHQRLSLGAREWVRENCAYEEAIGKELQAINAGVV